MMSIIGEHGSIRALREVIAKIASINTDVLVNGETGVGKELVAKEIHKQSSRRTKPFEPINCGALEEQLDASELFGHKRGAFTNAFNEREGIFVVADEGIVFLDEIGDLRPSTQVKLLRCLEERKVRPVGGNKEIHFDVRFVFATNRNLNQMVGEGTFREDLYYRISMMELHVPPLRERGDDIQLLASHFLAQWNEEHGKNIKGFTAAAKTWLSAVPFPGNVRQLRNVVRRAAFLAPDDAKLLDSTNLKPGYGDTALTVNSPLSMQETNWERIATTFLQSFRRVREGVGFADAFRDYNADDATTKKRRVDGKDALYRTFQYFCKTLDRKLLDPFDGDECWDWFFCSLNDTPPEKLNAQRSLLKARLAYTQAAYDWSVIARSTAMKSYNERLAQVIDASPVDPEYHPVIVGATASGMNAVIKQFASAIGADKRRWLEFKLHDLAFVLRTPVERRRLLEADLVVVWIHPYDSIEPDMLHFFENLKVDGPQTFKRVIFAVTVDYPVLKDLRANNLFSDVALKDVVTEAWGSPWTALRHMRWQIHVLPTLLERQLDLPGLLAIERKLQSVDELGAGVAAWLTDESRKPLFTSQSFEQFWRKVRKAARSGELTVTALEDAFVAVDA